MLAMANNPTLGVTGIFGSVIGAGVIALLIAPFVSRVLKLFPPVVTGTVIAVIGTGVRLGVLTDSDGECSVCLSITSTNRWFSVCKLPDSPRWSVRLLVVFVSGLIISGDDGGIAIAGRRLLPPLLCFFCDIFTPLLLLLLLLLATKTSLSAKEKTLG